MNKLIKLFDNIGFSCKSDIDIFIPIAALNSFNLLSAEHVGYYIPYLCRNVKRDQYETGVGLVKYNNVGDIVVEKHQVVASSNNNIRVAFEGSDNEFFLFANRNIFDNLLFNTIVINTNRQLESISALYLVDASDNDIVLTLPAVTDNAPIFEFKLVAGNIATLRSSDDHVVSVLSDNNSYLRLTNDGNNWVVLNTANNIDVQALSENNNFSALSDPQGSNYSLQYKLDASTFGATNSYWDPTNQRLLLGSDSASAAKTLLASSGNLSSVFNNTKNASDFIVYGSGSYDKNLFFSYDGRVGINIPSGSKPSTVFHIVNTVCQEGLRLENRTSCHPANITLYHKPSSEIIDGSTVSQIKLSAKNSAGNQTNYALVESRALNTAANSEKGSFDVTVISGVTGIRTIDSNTDYTTIGYGGARLQINNNGNIVLNNGSNQLTISPLSIALSNNININASGGLSAITISSTSGEFNTIKSTTISPSSLLTIDSFGRLSNSPLVLNNLGTLNLPMSAGKILNTTTSGAVTGIYSLDDYFLTQGDISWTKFSPRSASVCLKQITFIDTVSIDEFAVNDQLAVALSTGTVYRKIVSIDVVNSIITGLVVDQNISTNTVSSVKIYSITKGGYLTINSRVEDGTISDSSLTRISTRPLTDTVFNENQKDINFAVYGLDNDPALLVKANTGRSFAASGSYGLFASSRNDIFPIIVNISGVGISNSYSSANYDYDVNRNLFSGILSSVGSNGAPSFYGTYDQNGNASEWVEQPNTTESRDSEELVAGGSYLTSSVTGLKCVELLTRSSGYNDVGFRIASSYNLTDSSYVTSFNGLNLSFASISHPKNAPDYSITYLKQPSGSNPAYIPFVSSNLGSVSHNYRISKYEITNDQYCKFLNTVAKNNDRGLYDSRMGTSDVGGITRIFDSTYQYSTKINMESKPVVFVNYLSVIRFVNWLNNGSIQNLNENDIDYNLDTGAYTIISIGNNSYNIIKSANRKYWLPDLNEWHKAAYYKPSNSFAGEGSSTVSVCRSEPQIIASGINKLTGQSGVQFANLSVSGWLYVDHLIVGDGSFRSSQEFLNVNPSATTSQITTQTSVNNNANSYNNQWNNTNAIVTKSYVSCVASSGCYFDAKPLRLDDDTISLCSDQQLLATKNIPWWCATNNNGPGWFIQ